MKPLSPMLRASITRDANARAAQAVFADTPARLSAMEQIAEDRAASEAKTARLRALRLEQERHAAAQPASSES